MTAEPIDMHLGLVRARALQLGRRGFRVLRVHSNAKNPIDSGWPEHATADISILDEIIVAACNLGVACGFQPANGINLVVIDVDLAGLDAWAKLVEINGIPETAMHITPSGGMHIFFNAPPDSDFNNSRGKLPPGIDVRGRGGQVVVPPSRRGGEYYAAMRKGLGLWEHDVAEMPEWLVELLTPPPRKVDVDRSIQRHPSNEGISNADWLRDHWDWIARLESIGYEVVKQVGDVVYLRHPTATTEWSCTVNLSTGRMNAWSTNMPSPIRDKQWNTDGSVSWSPNDWFVAVNHGGDASAAAREINRMRAPLASTKSATPGAERAAPGVDEGSGPLYFPPEWYDQRPWMAACRQYAQAVGGSPGAHLLAFMTRWATLIPPGYTIPAINGAPSSFDLLSVIAGTSGSGKTSPMTNAEYMLPIHRKDLRMGLGLGSGEGMIEAFYAMEEVVDDQGKKSTERRKSITGINFAVSEGLIFAELAGRGGTTHVTRLCDAWSGTALSTPNAKAETFRHIDRGQYRLTMMMGIQAKQAHELMTNDAASQGFVGRLLFTWAEEPRVKPRPKAPEPPQLPVPPARVAEGIFQPTYLDYPDEVYVECQDLSDARVGTDVAVEDHHHDLLRCKVAGILALMDGRTTVTLDDWSIATDVVGLSARVRLHLYSIRRQVQGDESLTKAMARAEAEIVVESVKKRQAIAKMAENIRAKVQPGPMAPGALRKKVSYGGATGNRHLFDDALALALQNVWVRVEDGRVEAV